MVGLGREVGTDVNSDTMEVDVGVSAVVVSKPGHTARERKTCHCLMVSLSTTIYLELRIAGQ